MGRDGERLVDLGFRYQLKGCLFGLGETLRLASLADAPISSADAPQISFDWGRCEERRPDAVAHQRRPPAPAGAMRHMHD